MKKELLPIEDSEITALKAAPVVEPENIANGPILFLLVVLLLAILGGMYRWFVVLDKNVPTISTSLRPTAEQNNEPESTTAEAQVEAYGVVSTSDEIPAIEADVAGTNLDSLDNELNAIDAEIDAAVTSKTASSTQP